MKKILTLILTIILGVSAVGCNLTSKEVKIISGNSLDGISISKLIKEENEIKKGYNTTYNIENNKEKFAESVANSVNCVNLLVVPASVGAMILATPVVRILFERGAFNDRSTTLTATALVFYSVGMVGFGLRDILGKVFYSLKDTKTPMINGIIAVVLNIVLNIALVKVMGHGGLALATSLSAIICIILLFISLKKKIGYYGQDKIRSTFIKTVVASLVMGVVTYFVYKFLFGILGLGFIQEAISLGVSIAIGGAIYLALIIVFKVEEVNMAIDMIKKKLKR